jgi:hypothetical protein
MGAGALALAEQAAQRSESIEFCTCCHIMDATVFEEYRHTTHYANASGVRATCADCHVPDRHSAGEVTAYLSTKFGAVRFPIRGDAEDQSADGIDSDQARINLPYSFTQHRVDLDAGYEVWRRTTLGLGHAWEFTERDFQEVEELTEHSLRAIRRSQPWSALGTRLTYAHAWRTGDDYKGNLPFIAGHTAVPVEDALQACLASGLVPTPECPFENHPLLRKSYLADLESDEVKFMLTLLPLEALTVGLHLNWTLEDYHDSEVGLTEASRLSPGIDLSWMPMERITTHAFYSWQQYRTEQNGWSFQRRELVAGLPLLVAATGRGAQSSAAATPWRAGKRASTALTAACAAPSPGSDSKWSISPTPCHRSRWLRAS